MRNLILTPILCIVFFTATAKDNKLDACINICPPDKTGKARITSTLIEKPCTSSSCSYKVVVTENPSAKYAGKCNAEILYCALCVVPDKNSRTYPTLKYDLVDKSGMSTVDFEFRGDGVLIPKASSAAKKHFKRLSGNTSHVEWQAKRDKTPAGGLKHEASVYSTRSPQGQCDPIDPIIVNTGD